MGSVSKMRAMVTRIVLCLIILSHKTGSKRFLIETEDLPEGITRDGSDYINLPPPIKHMSGKAGGKASGEASGKASCPSNKWKEFGGHCYLILPDHYDIDICRPKCQKLGGELASVHSKEEED